MLAAVVAAAAVACSAPISGGTPPERAAIGRMVCLIPQTQIRGVQIVEPPARPGFTGPLGLRILLDSRVSGVANSRALWEAEVAGRAFTHGFARLGLPRIAAFAINEVGTPPERLDPAKEVVRTASARAPATPRRGETWTQIEARLDAAARRYGVRSRLDRVNAFSKTPAVTVVVSDPVRFLGGGGIVAFLKALHWGTGRYEAAYIGVRWRGTLVWTLTAEGGGGGCGFAIAPGGGRIDAAARACGLAGFDFP